VLKEEDLAAYIAAQGIETPIWYDVFPDGTPHECHVIAVSGGLGTALEGVLERPTLTVQTRGYDPANPGLSAKRARDLHAAFDAAFMDGPHPSTLANGDRLIRKERVGGATQGTYVRTDDTNRVYRAGNYYVEVER
jgi:hypothetical protein